MTKYLTEAEIAALVPPWRAPKLKALADACNNGACNVNGLSRVFSEASNEIPLGQHDKHPAYKVILGQLSFLVGESIGPSCAALADYERWAKIVEPKPTTLTPARAGNIP